MASKRIKPKAPPPFQTREEFEKAVDEIARLDIEVKKQEADLKKRHQELDDKFAPAIQEMSKSIQELMARAEPYFAANATKLCKPGQREGETPLARFGVRLGMPTVVKTISAAWKKLGELFFEKEVNGAEAEGLEELLEKAKELKGGLADLAKKVRGGAR